MVLANTKTGWQFVRMKIIGNIDSWIVSTLKIVDVYACMVHTILHAYNSHSRIHMCVHAYDIYVATYVYTYVILCTWIHSYLHVATYVCTWIHMQLQYICKHVILKIKLWCNLISFHHIITSCVCLCMYVHMHALLYIYD